METVLLVVQVLICLALIIVVLIQRSESDGFGLGSGSGANLLSGRGTANLLTRTTAILAALFMVNSLLLSVIVSERSDSPLSDVLGVQSVEKKKEIIDNNVAEPTTPSVPVEGDTAGDSLSGATKKALESVNEKPAVPEAN